MKFEVSRASGNEPPCEGAVEEHKVYVRHDGSEYHYTVWVIDIEDIMAFVSTYGKCILDPIGDDDGTAPAIKIYDGYVE